ncbi:MAG: efflux RND transporter permease subunit, partial [Microcystaceae cyanobacterium]
LKVNLLGDSSSTNFPTLVRFNGQDALAFQVIKRGDANTLEVVSQVEKAVKQLQADLPEVQLVLAETQAKYIREATHATIDALILAIILAILVIFPFLRSFRATLITALAIPISLLGTCIIMAISGFNLETITLLALALVIGIVVDDAIVDVENISRHIDQGETPKQAAIRGTNEIGLAVSASTLTIMAVFLPVAFMGRSVGQFFKPFGLIVSAAVLFSLLVARTLSPVLAVYWLKPKQREQGRRGDKPPSPITNRYRNLLHWSLYHRKIVLGIAILSFIVGIALIPLIPKGFIPKLDRGEFNIVYTTPLPKLLSRLNSENSQLPIQNPKSEDGAFAWLTDLAKS